LGKAGGLRLDLAQGLLRPLALDALADLAAEGRHQGDQVRVRVPDRLAEHLDDSQDVAAQHDGKATGRVQPGARGEGRAQKARVLDDIRYADGRPAGPDAARQAAPRPKRAHPGGGLKRRGVDEHQAARPLRARSRFGAASQRTQALALLTMAPSG